MIKGGLKKILINQLKKNDTAFQVSGRILGAIEGGKIRGSEEYARLIYLVRNRTANLPSQDEVLREFKTKLRGRGIEWPPNRNKGNLHIVYASFPSIWEENNIPPQLKKFGKVSTYYTRDRFITKCTKQELRAFIDGDFPKWVESLNKIDPIDLIVTYFSGAEITKGTVAKVKQYGIPIITFHWDDRLHFRGKLMAGNWSGPESVSCEYDLNLTNAPESLYKYSNCNALAIFWPEAANPEYYVANENIEFKYDVSFVGARYGVRDQLIKYLSKNGIEITAFGPGWPAGAITSDKILEVYHQSRINLGFGFIGFSNEQCLKGRDFEVPSCGTVYLTSHNKVLESMYQNGVEILTYHDFQDCRNKIKHLLSNPDICESIRKKARDRVLGSHTWEHRFDKIFGYV